MLTVCLTVISISLFLYLYLSSRRCFPPGPGFLESMNMLMDGDPRPAFSRLREKYGDIFTVYFGTMQVVIMNGYDVLVDAFIKQGDKFSDRPKMCLSDELGECGKGVGLTFSSGRVWSEQRKLMFSTLRELGMGKKCLERKVKEEINKVLDIIESKQGQVTDFHKHISRAVSNIISSIVFGKRFESTDRKFERFISALDENVRCLTSTSIISLFPFLSYLPGDLFKLKQVKANRKMINDELITPAIEQHKRDYDEDNIADYIDYYIKAMKEAQRKGQNSTTINDENLKKSISDLFIAGTESTSTTIIWALLYFLHYPEVQRKCFEEIKEKIGTSHTPSLRDKVNLPYVEATLMEVQRHADISPLSGSHSPVEDIIFHGYHFKKGDVIFPNIHSVHHDPKVWTEPDQFDPERFLDENGKVIKRKEFIPFFIGHRNCLGESLAQMVLFIFLSAMIQKFEFVNEEGGDTPPLKGVMRIIHSPIPFKCRATLRC